MNTSDQKACSYCQDGTGSRHVTTKRGQITLAMRACKPCAALACAIYNGRMINPYGSRACHHGIGSGRGR